MAITLSGTSGVTYPAGGLDNVAGAGVGTTDTQTLTNKTLTSPTVNSPTIGGTPVIGASLITSGTAVASTSGTSIDFTSIPSWVKRVTVMFQGLSHNGTSPFIMRLGTTSGFATSGYLCAGVYVGASTGSGNRTDGLLLCGNALDAATTVHGHSVITNISANSWVQSFVMGQSDGAYAVFGGGSIALSGTLTQIRITTPGGTNTFDAGSINILYE